jgi:hypothetical protein
MGNGTGSRFLSIAALASAAFGQQAKSHAAPVTGAAAEVLAFERDMEAATVRGDVAWVDRFTADDFSFTHGDGWIAGNKPLDIDD